MTVRDDFDLTLREWLLESAGSGTPDYVEETLDGVWRIDQPAGWMRPWSRVGAFLALPRRSVVREAPFVVLVGVLVGALIISALIAGSRQTLPTPFGLARSGLIAFEADGDIYLAAPDGTATRVLVGDAADQFAPSWSADGTRLAFWSAPDHRYPADLWVVGPDGSDPIKVTGNQTYFDDGPAVWSPDGSRLAFATRTGELHVVGADGTTDRRIGDDALRYSLPSWSPDGSRLAARGFGPADDTDYYGYVVGADDGTRARIGPANVSGIAHGGYAWAADGDEVVYHLWRSEADLDVAASRVASDGAWHDEVRIGGPTRDVLPVLSNDGTRLAFIRTEAFGTAQQASHLMVADADGSDIRMLSDMNVDQTAPCWSPDDRRIEVASSSSADLRPVIMLVGLDGTAVEVAAPGRASLSCAWQRLAP